MKQTALSELAIMKARLALLLLGCAALLATASAAGGDPNEKLPGVVDLSKRCAAKIVPQHQVQAAGSPHRLSSVPSAAAPDNYDKEHTGKRAALIEVRGRSSLARLPWKHAGVGMPGGRAALRPLRPLRPPGWLSFTANPVCPSPLLQFYAPCEFRRWRCAVRRVAVWQQQHGWRGRGAPGWGSSAAVPAASCAARTLPPGCCRTPGCLLQPLPTGAWACQHLS